MPRIEILADVVDWRLCVGCGVCAYICPDERVQLVDFAAEGIRPVVSADDCKGCTLCLEACPGVSTDLRIDQVSPATSRPNDALAAHDFSKHWGAVVEVWEGHAADAEIRFKGSSGGVLTALAAYCLERAGMYGVLHTGQDPADPIRNRTRLSRTRGELLAATGSRYSPASVGNGLKLVEAAPAPCAIIGQPSDIAGVARARTLRPELERKIALTMSFFCAGSPPTAATKSLLQAHGVDADAVADLRYRGLGWPGHFAANLDGQSNPSVKLTYRESWAFLQAFRPWSVQMWPDSSGELADISCGDPWYFEPDGVNPGSSIVLVRTERGREILRGAISAGFLHLQCAEPWKVEKSQQGLWRKKGSVWGRQLAHRMLGLPTTEISGGHLWDCWKELTLGEKLRSVFGTGRRILQRKLYIPGKLRTEEGAPVRPAVLAEGLRK